MGANQEWLVTDQKGGFAMGTLEGIRTRKYHGFYLGVTGRAEAAFLVTFELEIEGRRLWPTNPVEGLRYEGTEWGPRWVWDWEDGVIAFQVQKNFPAGIRLIWNWSGKRDLNFKLRPIFAMRALHETEGNLWTLKDLGHGTFQIDGATDGSDDGVSHNQAFCQWSGKLQWKDEPNWFKNFFYTQEQEHGHADHENLFSAGVFDGCLRAGSALSLTAAQYREDLAAAIEDRPLTLLRRSDYPYPALDFVLDDPAGIVAGFPWFGEMGRDTFVSLPGIVCARLAADEDLETVTAWAYELLERWGSWIDRVGMIPSANEKGGSHQWESADATLWYCHALAALWVLTLDRSAQKSDLFADFEQRFAQVLRTAIQSISDGRHMFLKKIENGLLEVTEAHVTWMDAQIDAAPVSPRTGVLPEINALWFQARFLNFLWGGDEDLQELERLGSEVLKIRETDRPNDVFLHSLPLAPSFILKDWKSVREDLGNLRRRFLTPVGLRSLAPDHPDYQGRVIHQGGAWAWLKGHFEMAEQRLNQNTTTENWPTELPIQGHIPEVFDGNPPHESLGAPAQAWSLACDAENRTRKARGLDTKLSRVLARRWMREFKDTSGRRKRA